jgi:hypothetical protein
MTNIYFLTENGSGMTPDGTFPDGSVICTEDQYKNQHLYTIKKGKIVNAKPEKIVNSNIKFLNTEFKTDSNSVQKISDVLISGFDQFKTWPNAFGNEVPMTLDQLKKLAYKIQEKLCG